MRKIKRKQRKHSIRVQIAVTFIGLVILSLLLIVIINQCFLEQYYVSRKIKTMEKAFGTLSEFETIKDPEEIPQEWTSESRSQNLSWLIVAEADQDWIIKVAYGYQKDIDIMSGRLFGYTHGLETADKQQNVRYDILKKEDNYIVQKYKESVLGVDYIEVWGILSNGCYCMVRSPLESIRDSVQISNSFFLFVGCMIVVASGICVLMITKTITQPISELTKLSLKMADLDFNARYTSVTNNEIDVLGENFNKMSSELEHTITELKNANMELKQDIEMKTKLEEQRREFLGNVSHELKTPIALIQGYAEGLKDNIMDDEESREFYCDVIIDESMKMNQLVKSLLSLSHLESGQDSVDIERFDLVALIRGVLQKSHIMIEQKEAKIEFTEEEAIYVWADEFKIEEVVTNYLTNALNHLDGEHRIKIQIDRTSPVKVSIFNTGKPIPEEDLPNIWNKFYKVDKAHSRQYGGSGIGLSIVKAIVQNHQQTCGVKNQSDGVTFWFTIDGEKK